MANPFTDVRNAVWALLDAHAGLSDFIEAREGTRYRFGESENLPTRLAADDCPALVVDPAKARIDWESAAGRSVQYRVEISGWVHSTEAAEIEEFAYLVYEAICGGLPDLGVAAVEGVEFAGPAFETWRTGGARFEGFRLGVVARIHSEA